MMRFRKLIDDEFRNSLSLEDYASRLGITPTHLNRLCRAHLDQSALGVLNSRIALEAKRLLIFTSLTVKEVAAALSFDDAGYFTRFFRHETGLAPTLFRQRRHAYGQAAKDGSSRGGPAISASRR